MAAVLEASVIICAHNPRLDYLKRVMHGLRNQSFPLANWEFLLVDNGSKVPLAGTWDISWHPHARHIREEQLGLAIARRRAMREATADLLIFVDDDNVLVRDYISDAVAIKHAWSHLGVWGSGAIIPEFESQPKDCVRELLPYLALREMPSPQWSNVFNCIPSMPWGAGMCVRANVAQAYCQVSQESAIHIVGRGGKKSLMSGEDVEICHVACKVGLGMATFPQLKVTHLIPKERVTPEYLLGVFEGTSASNALLDYKWTNKMPISPLRLRSVLSMLHKVCTRRNLHLGIFFRTYLATIRAASTARHIIIESQANSSQSTRAGSL